MEGAQPQTSMESAQPQTSTGSAQRQTSTGNAQLQTSTGSAQPQTSMGNAQLQTSTGTAQPQTSMGTAQPPISTVSAQPQTSTWSAQPQTSTWSAQPQTITESVQPQTSTWSAQPQTITESVQPQTSVESTSCETSIKSIIKQRIIAASAQRQISTGNAQPQTSTGSAQPQTITGSAQSQTITESVQPQTSTWSAQPQISTVSGQPQTSVESTLCETSIKSIIKQRIIAASAQRQISMEGAQPQTSTGSAQPQTSTGSAQPQTSTGNAQPQTSTGNAQPQTSSESAQPQTSTENAQPQTSTESAQPQTSVESTLCETSIKSISKKQIIAASDNRPELQIIALPMLRQPVTEDGRQIITQRIDFLYTWDIVNYSESSELIAEKFESTVFPDQDPDSTQHFSWSLELYPRGSNPQFDEYISMKILCRNPYKRYIKAECQFKIENCKRDRLLVMECEFDYVETGVYTIEKWLKRDILEQEKETMLQNGVLSIICGIRTYLRTTSTVNITKYSRFALSEDIKKLYLNPKFSDYTLISRKHKFPVHKSILSARSTIFKLMFQCDTDSVSTKIRDVNTGVLKELLRFIYTDRVKNLKKHAMKLMIASDLYGVYGCKVMCEKVICNDLKADEALDLLVICHNHAARYLEEEVRTFIYANAKDVVNSPSYKMVRRKNFPILRSVLETLASWKTQEESKNLL